MTWKPEPGQRSRAVGPPRPSMDLFRVSPRADGMRETLGCGHILVLHVHHDAPPNAYRECRECAERRPIWLAIAHDAVFLCQLHGELDPTQARLAHALFDVLADAPTPGPRAIKRMAVDVGKARRFKGPLPGDAPVPHPPGRPHANVVAPVAPWPATPPPEADAGHDAAMEELIERF